MENSLIVLGQELMRLTGQNFPETTGLPELEMRLASYLNTLINEDFNQLVQILYRIDVSEPKLKQLLQQNPNENAGLLIARMIIERQLEKIKSRQSFQPGKDTGSDEERW